MRTFKLVRIIDDSGVSGTGVVAEGVLFSNDAVVISWLTEHQSLGIYPSMEELIAIHGHGGHTVVEYDLNGYGV